MQKTPLTRTHSQLGAANRKARSEYTAQEEKMRIKFFFRLINAFYSIITKNVYDTLYIATHTIPYHALSNPVVLLVFLLKYIRYYISLYPHTAALQQFSIEVQ